MHAIGKKIIRGLATRIHPEILSRCSSALNGALLHEHAINEKLQQWYWNTMASRNTRLSVPFRPSPSDIASFRQCIRESPSQKTFLLLGSTPEIRDLLSEFYGTATITICDFSPHMTATASEQLQRAHPGKEVCLFANWMDDALQKNDFDIIMGDLPLLQFSPKELTLFLARMNALLSSEGRFIIRCRMRRDTEGSAYTSIIHSYMQSKGETTEAIARSIVWSSFDYFTDDATKAIDRKEAILALKDVIHSDQYSSVVLDAALKKMISTKKEFDFRWKWGSPRETELLAVFKKIFNIPNAIHICGRDETSVYKIFSLKKYQKEK